MPENAASKLKKTLAALARSEGTVHAFAQLDAHAAAPDHAAGALAGCALGVKDIIDVAGMPTRAGSAARADASPAREDAEVVRRLRAAGAIILGKTHTTEFAYRNPAPTRNPWNLAHTPGGSSSGSAAAVAAGMLDLALGTQTAGSVCRPAAYCGVAAIKPTYGSVPTAGILPLAPSFDTVGCFARSVTLVAQAFLVMSGNASVWEPQDNRPITLGVLPKRFNAESTPAINAFHERTIERLRANGFRIEQVEPPADFEAVVADHRIVMQTEAWRSHRALYETSRARLGPHLRELIENGSKTNVSEYEAALARIHATGERTWAALQGVDALLLQPVPDVAPHGLENTGSPVYITPWTAFRGPMVVVPGELEPGTGLPLAAMIAAAPRRDIESLRVGERIQRLIDQVPNFALWG